MTASSSVLVFFILGTLFLVIPLVLILFWNGSGCFGGGVLYQTPAGYCPSGALLKNLIPFLPFLMLVGGVLIGYNLKRISDSYAPPEDEITDDEEDIEADKVDEEGLGRE